jgi:multisubunit Na+/H+ antiporter MnhF subunit
MKRILLLLSVVAVAVIAYRILGHEDLPYRIVGHEDCPI